MHVVQEVREIRFWFKSSVAEERRNELTEDFFKDLLSPTDFPTGFPSVRRSRNNNIVVIIIINCIVVSNINNQ